MPIEVDRKDTLFQSIILLLVILLLGLLLASSRNSPTQGNSPASGQASSDLAALTSTPGTPPPTSTPRPIPGITPTQTPPASRIRVDASLLDGVSISFWHPWSGETGKTIEALVAEFNRSNPWGITASSVAQSTYDSLSDSLGKAIQAGEPPDVVTGYAYQALNWDSPEGTLVDLSDYAADSIWGFTPAEQKDFYPLFWEHDKSGEKRTGIPARRSAQLIYYNLTWAQELGFNSPPTTPEQFKTQACAAAQANKTDRRRENDGTGGWIISTDYPASLGWIAAFGGEVVRLDGKGYQFDTPPVSAAFTFLRSLLDSGCAWIPQGQFTEEEFASRGGLFSVGTVPSIPIQEKAFADIASKDEWTVLPFPSPLGKPMIEVYGPSFQMLRSTSEKQLASWLLVKWLVSPEAQSRLALSDQYYPVRQSSLDGLASLLGKYPQWEKAVSLLGSASSEPPFQSWTDVRWAVSDAATQLFRSYFSIDQVPTLVGLLDQTAQDLQQKTSPGP